MVYPSAGRAKNLSSMVNQTNTSGGIKKPGLPSTVGIPSSVSGVYRQKVGCPCPFIISMTTMCTHTGKPAGIRGRC